MRARGRAALVPASALAVHQLRYWLAFGSNATAELQAQGHSYLHSVVPWIVLLIAISAGVFLRALGRALGGRCSLPRYTLSFAALWLVCAACLVAIYVCQEFLEGLFATGHPGGLVGIFGDRRVVVGAGCAGGRSGPGGGLSWRSLGASGGGPAASASGWFSTPSGLRSARASCLGPAAAGAAGGWLVGPRTSSLAPRPDSLQALIVAHGALLSAPQRGR